MSAGTPHADDLPERLRDCRSPDVLGANVTVPHKVAVIDLVDELSPAARRAGAVNTIVNRAGSLFGDNTDIAGFMATVKSRRTQRRLDRALVLGAGGAARAVVLALEAMGVSTIIVANRGEARAQALADSLAPAPVVTISLDGPELVRELAKADILVNSTSVGWQPNEAPLDLDLLAQLPRNALVVDLTYRQTDLLTAAANLGLESVDGLPMLVHQGAAAFELFTGQRPPIETMFAAAEEARQ